MKIEIKAMIDRILNHNIVLVLFSHNTCIMQILQYSNSLSIFFSLGRLEELNISILNICANKLYIYIYDFGSYIFVFNFNRLN